MTRFTKFLLLPGVVAIALMAASASEARAGGWAISVGSGYPAYGYGYGVRPYYAHRPIVAPYYGYRVRHFHHYPHYAVPRGAYYRPYCR